jgi:adenylate kinase family enzyme
MTLVRERGLAPPVAVLLDIPDDEARKRLKSRGARDDTPEIIEQRIKDYHREMDFLHLYFPDMKIHKLDGTKKPDQVSKDLKKILDPLLAPRR